MRLVRRARRPIAPPRSTDDDPDREELEHMHPICNPFHAGIHQHFSDEAVPLAHVRRLVTAGSIEITPILP